MARTTDRISSTQTPSPRTKRAPRSNASEPAENGHRESPRTGHGNHRNGQQARASNGGAPATDWAGLSPEGRAEIEQLVETLKSVKRGDFSARFEYQTGGMLGRAGELLNDIL